MIYTVRKDGQVVDDLGLECGMTEIDILKSASSWIFFKPNQLVGTYSRDRYCVIDKNCIIAKFDNSYCYDYRAHFHTSIGFIKLKDVLIDREMDLDDSRVVDIIDKWYFDDVDEDTLIHQRYLFSQDKLDKETLLETLNKMTDSQKLLYILNNGRFSKYLVE